MVVLHAKSEKEVWMVVKRAKLLVKRATSGLPLGRSRDLDTL